MEPTAAHQFALRWSEDQSHSPLEGHTPPPELPELIPPFFIGLRAGLRSRKYYAFPSMYALNDTCNQELKEGSNVFEIAFPHSPTYRALLCYTLIYSDQTC